MRASPARWHCILLVCGLTLGFGTIRADDKTAPPAPDSAEFEAFTERAARLAERDKLWDEAWELFANGDATNAEVCARAVLGIELAVLGEDDPELILTLDLVARCRIAREAWEAAQVTREEIVIRCEAAYGEHDYRTVDARLAVENVIVLARLTPADRAELSEAADLYAEVSRPDEEGRFSDAAAIAERVLETRRRILGERDRGYAASLNRLAQLFQDQGEYSRAEPLYREALDIREEILGKRRPDYAASLNNLALLYREQADYARAEPLFREALDIKREILGKRHLDYGVSLHNLGLLYSDQGDYTRAEPLFLEALDINREILGEGDPEYANILNSLGVLYRDQGDYTRAEPLYREALDIIKNVLGERTPDYARNLNNLALLYWDQADYVRAEPLLRESLDLKREILGERHPDYAISLNCLALLYQDQGDCARAEPLFRQSLDITREALGEAHPGYAIRLRNLALLLADLQRPQEALDASVRAAGTMNELLEASAGAQSERQQLAMLASCAHFSGAVLALGRLADAEGGEIYSVLLVSKGQIFLRQRSMRQLRQAAAADPDSEEARIFAQLTDRTRELDRLVQFAPAPEALEERTSRLEQMTFEIERLQQDLAGLDAGFRRSRELAARTPDDLAACLPTDAALIDFREYTQYWPRDEEHPAGRRERQYAALITRHDRPVQIVWLGAAGPINDAIAGWREGAVYARYGGASADDLRRLVWEPLAPFLDGVTTVLISPDGALHTIPFGALPGAEADTYLIEERAFVTVPAPLLLPEILERTAELPTDPSLLLVGDVDYGSDPGLMELAATDRAAAARDGDGPVEWRRLGQIRVEVVSIDDTFERVFRRAPSISFREAEATEQAFRDEAPAATYVHIATHGYFAPEQLKSMLAATRADAGTISLFGQQDVSGWHPGLLSGIVLAGANHAPDPTRDDGVLTALEVAELDLSGVEMATLSACETGLGQTAGGEGLLGLQRSFQLAGARTTVASLWKVEDAATRSLMTEFYENLWRKKLPRVEALRAAQLSMLRGELDRGITAAEAGDESQRVPPYYWAAFVLSGDWR